MNSIRFTLNALTTRPGAPWLLDLYCRAGGAAVGYWLAGFNVLGVDILPQKNYPFWFVQSDALVFVKEYGYLFDVIHASPTCKSYSEMQKIANTRDNHPRQIPDTRTALLATGKPYVIENVEGARQHLLNPIELCGATFGLKVYRHRLFESSVYLFQPPHQKHGEPVPPAGRGKSADGFFSLTSGGITGVTQEERWQAMYINWMTNAELNDSISPMMTKYIGEQLMRHVLNSRRIMVA